MDSEIKSEADEWTGILIPAFIGLAALVFFTYGSSLGFGFLVNSDDQAYIFRNPYLLDISIPNLRAIFTKVHFDSYLPMTLLSYSLDYTVWKFQSFGYHLTQILLHTVNSFLVLIVLLLARIPRLTALCAAFMYSIHPVHAESVVWISERKNLLSAFFIFLSLICYIRHTQEAPARRRYYFASLGLFVLALLSKSIAVILPFVLILYDLCRAGRGWRLVEKVPFLIGSVATAGITIFTQGEAGAIKQYPGGNLWTTVLYMLRIYWDYISSLLFPFSLSPEYHYVKADFLDWQSLLSYVLIPTVIVAAAIGYRVRPLFAFAVGWFFLWLLPVSNIIPLATLRQDRYLYLPSLALTVIVAQIVLTQARLRPKYGVIVLGVIVLLLASLTHSHSDTYASDRAVRMRVAELYPEWTDAQFDTGYQCWSEKDLNCAIYYYRRAIEADPKNAQALMNIGAILIDQGEYRQAKDFLEKAIASAPDSALAYHNLAVIALKTGEEKEKIPQWVKKSEELKSMEKKREYRLGAFRNQ